ncbi:putative hemolysin [Amphibacillus marinus]|uniref:Putative hemolysin n=1 Tax=Amphibacillus marinus TaxID=872970 RepID=A0A1H8MKB9_9BACI|nr:hemolysin family protein [Amphibacillus marinus]SEO17688.1 putative hemolysin [Amphibacillus marinus]
MGSLIILIVLILLNAFFAASEIALVSLNDNKIEREADRGDKTAQLINRLLKQPGRFLATIQIGITLAGFLASAFAADTFAAPVAEFLYEWGLPLSLPAINTIAVFVITILLSYFTLVFGELVPKQLALQKAETIARFVVKPITILFKVSLPIVVFLNASTNLFVRLFGVDPNAQNDEATEEEIRMMIDIGGERGTINTREKMMIHNIFEFNDKRVSDVMTHRTAISAIDVRAGIEDIIKKVSEERYTRYPIYDQHIDQVVGILHTKDLIPLLTSGSDSFVLERIMREPYFIINGKSIDEVFRMMQAENLHIAIVIDEYGGTHGLVTIEDLIEEIVGEISSEHGINEDQLDIERITANEAIVKGKTHLVDFNEYFGVELPIGQHETINGFLINQFGRIPQQDEQAEHVYKNITFSIVEVSDKRIEKIHVSIN